MGRSEDADSALHDRPSSGQQVDLFGKDLCAATSHSRHYAVQGVELGRHAPSPQTP